MRKSALSTKSNKVYNPNILEITGDKLSLLIPEKAKTSKKLNKKTIKIDSVDQEEPYTIQKPYCQIHSNHVQLNKPNKQYNKNYLKPSITEYTNTEISNKVLRQIRETTKVEDFERILQNLTVSDKFLNGKGYYYINQNQRDQVLENLEVEDLYEEFFGKHFDYLARVVNEASETSKSSEEST